MTACYLCDSTDFEAVRGRVRDRPELGIQKCRSCGLVRLSSFDHARDELYRDSGMHGPEPDIAAWMHETEADDDRRARYCLPHLGGKRVMDFGCGNGGFLMRVKGVAGTVAGVDLEKALTSHFRDHAIPLYSSVEEVQGPFDLVTLFHVLEHLRDPRAILRQLQALVAHDGHILIEVPNANDALLQLYECEGFSRFTYWSFHLYLFTAETLAMLFHQVGARTQYIRHIQRYPLSNHLHWLAKGRPGGHKEWSFLDTPLLAQEYEKQLASIGMTDTLLADISFPSGENAYQPI